METTLSGRFVHAAISRPIVIDKMKAQNYTSDEIKKALGTSVYAAYDISLYSNAKQTKITRLENSKFEVSIPIPENLKDKDITVYYITDAGDKEEHTASGTVSLQLQMDTDNTLERHERKVEICRYVVKNLMQSADSNKAVTFSLIDLLNQYNANAQQTMFGQTEKATIMDMEEALLFLSKVELLKIDGGFMVTYNTMQIHRQVDRARRYGKEQYDSLRNAD